MTQGPIEVVIPKNLLAQDGFGESARKAFASQFAAEIQGLTSILEAEVGVESNLRRVRLFNVPHGSRMMAYYVPRNLTKRHPSGFVGRSLETDWARRLEKTGEADEAALLPADTLWLGASAATALMAGLQQTRQTRFAGPIAEPVDAIASMLSTQDLWDLVSIAFENVLHELIHSLQKPKRVQSVAGQFEEALVDSITRAFYGSVARAWGILPALTGPEPVGLSGYVVHNAMLDFLLEQTGSRSAAQRVDRLTTMMQSDGRDVALVMLATDLLQIAGIEPDAPALLMAYGTIATTFRTAAAVEREVGDPMFATLAPDTPWPEMRRFEDKVRVVMHQRAKQLGGELIQQIRTQGPPDAATLRASANIVLPSRGGLT